MGLNGQRDAATALPPGKRAGTLVQEDRYAPWPVRTGVERRKYTAATGLRTLNLQPVASRYIDDAPPVPRKL